MARNMSTGQARRKNAPRIYRPADRSGVHRSSEIKPRKSSSWPDHDDKLLMEMRAKSHPWNEIAEAFGRTEEGALIKSPNACRKRYERLSQYESFQKVLERYSEEEIATVYMDIKVAMWKMLADKLGCDYPDALEAAVG